MIIQSRIRAILLPLKSRHCFVSARHDSDPADPNVTRYEHELPLMTMSNLDPLHGAFLLNACR
jgi:hypothetical protein